MFDGPFGPAAPRRRRSFDARKLLPVARQNDDPVSRAIALRLLGNPSEAAVEIDRLLSYPPSPAAVRQGKNAIWEYLLTDIELDGLNAALGELLRAAKAEDEGWVGLAATGVADEYHALVRAGIDGVCLGRLIEWWSRTTDGAPRMNITVSIHDTAINDGE
jgi:hypothetical protein